MEEFYTFLQNKKIDPGKFEKGDPDRYREFQSLFEQVHPDSLVAQKLFLINQIRRKYPFVAAQTTADQPTVKPKMKPKITPKK